MDGILSLFGGLTWVFVVVAILVIALIVFIFVRSRYKIASANQALVITGGKGEPKIRVGGGAFVPPFRKAEFFDLGLLTVTSTNEATHTNTMIPVVVEWTAQLRVDTSKDENGDFNQSLQNAILGFTGYDGDISDSLQQTLEGEVRAVIATMTPEDLVRNKADFADNVDKNVRDSMSELGFKLASLNIGKITDPNGYYDNLAAKDREEKRREASNLKADADQAIAIRNAETNRASRAAEQQRDLAVAEQNRELDLRRAAIQAETDVAKADAEASGQLQQELRNQELETRRGQTAVVKEQQRQAAAIARREVDVTEAETAAQKVEIDAQADAKKSEINAQAAAEVAKRTAQGEADAAGIRAQGEADAINRTTEAKARQIREQGLAAAEVSQAQGEADAAATLARGKAEAEAQRLMAEALAANDGANLRISLAEIDSKTRITIATESAKVMAEVGKHAKFVDMGGSGSSQGGDLLTRTLGGIPGLLARLDAGSDALHDTSFGGAVGAALAAIKNGGDPVQAFASAASGSDEQETIVVPVTTDASPLDAPASETPASSESTSVEDDTGQVSSESELPPFGALGLTPEAAGVVLDKAGGIDAVLAIAESEGKSLTDLAAGYGISEETLNTVLTTRFTPEELLAKGIKVGIDKAKGRRGGSRN